MKNPFRYRYLLCLVQLNSLNSCHVPIRITRFTSIVRVIRHTRFFHYHNSTLRLSTVPKRPSSFDSKLNCSIHARAKNTGCIFISCFSFSRSTKPSPFSGQYTSYHPLAAHYGCIFCVNLLEKFNACVKTMCTVHGVTFRRNSELL